MRVTKLIKEYVEKTVNEKMPNPEKPVDIVVNEYNALIDSLEAHCKNAVKEFVHQHGGEFRFCYSGYDVNEVDQQAVYGAKNCSIHYPSISSLVIKEYNEACQKMREKRREVIDDILISLELGGTKKDLDELLANLPD